jgi:hypothetical protein
VAVAAKRDPSIDSLVIDGKTGYTFDAGSCAEVLYDALTSDNAKITKNALQSIQGFSSEAFARAVEATYAEAIENKPKKWHKVKLPRVITSMASFVVDLRKPSLKGLKFRKKD